MIVNTKMEICVMFFKNIFKMNNLTMIKIEIIVF